MNVLSTTTTAADGSATLSAFIRQLNRLGRSGALIVAALLPFIALPASAKLGETVPQLMKRFGKSYTVEPVELGKTYKFRSTNISVDAVVTNGVSVAETYLSDRQLKPRKHQ